MQVGINQVKSGSTIEIDNTVYTIVDWKHVKPGKGGAFIRTKLKNIKLGTVIDRTFRPSEKVELAYIDKKTIQYLYSSKDMYEFMDHETYDQISLHRDELGGMVEYLKENLEVTAIIYKKQVIAL
ncbi:MAG: elongation factor P, partial [Candidatus Omnitrophica bacterium]|nr:elongation factor P [Candidatus Omnitrophota bacterium]